MKTVDNLPDILQDEWYLVRYSGETPEIALHASLYHLSRAKDGPRLTLSQDYCELLKDAAVARFSEIILRDLQHANYGTQVYRGVARSIINYRRFITFCARQNLDPENVRRQTGEALLAFLRLELEAVDCEKRCTIINCTFEELHVFSTELGVRLPEKIDRILASCHPVG